MFLVCFCYVFAFIGYIEGFEVLQGYMVWSISWNYYRNMQIRFELTPDENASIVPLARYLFSGGNLQSVNIFRGSPVIEFDWIHTESREIFLRPTFGIPSFLLSATLIFFIPGILRFFAQFSLWCLDLKKKDLNPSLLTFSRRIKAGGRFCVIR